MANGPTIPQALQPQQRGLVKPPTVAEQRIIRQYGSVEAGRAIQAQQVAQRTQTAYEETLRKIESGEISTDIKTVQDYEKFYQSIPQSARQFFANKTPAQIKAQQQKEINKLESERASVVETRATDLRDLEFERSRVSGAERKAISVKIAEQKLFYSNYIKGLSQNLTKLRGGLLVSAAGLIEEASFKGVQARQERRVTKFQQARRQQDIYQEVVTKFGTELDPQEIIQLTPEQAQVVGLSQTDLGIARQRIEQQKVLGVVGVKTEIKTPPGWAPEGALELYRKTASRIGEIRGETSWEEHERITSDPTYQKELQRMAGTSASLASMKRFAEGRGLDPEQFGQQVSVKPSLTYEQSIQLAERGEAVRYGGTFLGQAFDIYGGSKVPPLVEPVAKYVGIGLSGIGTGLKYYATEFEITKVGQTINLPITNQGLDIVKMTGDILNRYEFEKQSEIIGSKKLGGDSIFLSKEVNKLSSATTQEQIDKILRDIKNKGIKVEEITTETGELSYKFNIPIPKALRNKLDASTLASFFISASGVAYGTTFAGLTLSPGGLESTAGRIGTVVGETAPYLFGGFGGALIAEPFIEKGLYGEPGELREYAIEHPFESLLLGAVVAGGIYGGVQRVRAAKRFKSFTQAKAELKRLQEYHKTIQPKPIGKGASYFEGYSGKLTKTQFKQLQKLNIEERLLEQSLNVKFSASYQEFSRTVPTMSKTSKGFYEINEFGKTVKFFNNQFTITFFTKEGRAVTITLAARSNRPLKTLEAFMKYGRDKRIITGVGAGDFTALSMGRYWGGELRRPETFIAKETEKGLIETRKTFGAERYTDDFAELFGISTPVSKTKFKVVKGAKKPIAFGEISITEGDSVAALFTGTKQTGVGIQFTQAEVGIGSPFFTKLVKEQAILKGKYIKPKIYDFGFADDVITKAKPKPRPDVLSSDIFGTGRGLVQEQKVVKTTKDIIAAQEVATRSLGITDIRTRAPPKPDVPSRFGEVFLGESRFGGLGTFEGRLKITTDEVDRVKVDDRTAGGLIYGAEVKGRVKVKEKEVEADRLFDSIAPISRTISEPKIEAGLRIAPIQMTGLKQQQILKQEAISITDFGVPIIPGEGAFFFPGEKPSLRFIPPPFPERKRFIKGTRIGYHTFIKDKGRYRKVTDVPHTREGARDVGARFTDNLLSADFKISPVKQTKVVKGKRREIIRRFQEDELRKGDDYFNRNVHKFRNFMIRRGQKIQMQDRWIEKKQYRSDKKSEQQGLTLFQFKARETKRRAGLPVRRTKKKRTSKQRFRL